MLSLPKLIISTRCKQTHIQTQGDWYFMTIYDMSYKKAKFRSKKTLKMESMFTMINKNSIDKCTNKLNS
jgi:hypothetical protein